MRWQVSWPFYNVYLGIVSVFHAGDPHDTWGRGKVHCELAWSRDGATYERVAPGVDFIPLGPHGAGPGDGANAFDSHVCFASSFPVKLANETRQGQCQLLHPATPRPHTTLPPRETPYYG